MASRRDWAIELVAGLIDGQASQNKIIAEIIIDRLQEEGVLNLGYGDKDVEKIVATFTEVFGTTRTSRYDRFAAHRLASKYDAQAVSGIIVLLGQKRDEPYIPVVASISDVEKKWVNIMHFLRNNKDTEIIDA